MVYSIHSRRHSGATTACLVAVVSVVLVSLVACSEGGPIGEEPDKGAQVDDYGAEIGAVEFPVSCNESAARHVARGLALLHHMMYHDADRTFEAAAAVDPDCAMAYWGRAIVLIHPLWPDLPSLQQLNIGFALVEQAAALPSTPRERAYIEAVAAYFRDASKRSEDDRLTSYAEAWKTVYERFPNDREGALLFALAHMASADPGDKTYQKQREAGAIAEAVLVEVPDHPGGHHYVIHAYDLPTLDERALEVARNYGKIGPDVPHATHMPSHIFTRLGLWRESIEWNRRSAAAAHRQEVEAGLVSTYHLHALDYLLYAYLQTGEDRKAEEVRDLVVSLEGPYMTLNRDNSAYHLSAAPARYALERHAWAEAARLEPRHPASFPWDEGFGRYVANTFAARALGRVRTGNVDGAHDDLERSEELLPGHAETALAAYYAGETEILQAATRAWILYTEGAQDAALEAFRAVAEREAARGGGAPSELLPANELFGEMLLKIERPEDALAAYQSVLARRPKRLNSLIGAGRAAEMAGDEALAADYYRQAMAVAGSAGGGSARLTLVKNYLSAHEAAQ